MAINFHTDKELTGIELVWCQFPLPMDLGAPNVVVALQTSFGRVLVDKQWFDNNVVKASDGLVQWQTLLALLEEQVVQGSMAHAQHLFDPESV
jgi:hypothetical protein